MSVRVPPAGGTGAVGFDNRYLLDRSRNKEQDFDFGFVTAGPVKAAYVPRLRIKPFVVRFSRVKVAVGSAFTRSSRSDRGGASTRFFFVSTSRSVVDALSSML